MKSFQWFVVGWQSAFALVCFCEGKTLGCIVSCIAGLWALGFALIAGAAERYDQRESREKP